MRFRRLKRHFVLAIAGILPLSFASCNLAARTPRQAVDRGHAFYAQGKYADASLQFRKAIQLDSKFAGAYLGLGLSEVKQSHWEPAYAALNQAVTLAPGDDQPKIQLANLCLMAYLGDRNQRAALYGKAAQLTAKLLRKDPDSFPVLRLRGYLAIADQKPGEAVVFFRRANELKPDEADVATMLVQNLQLDRQSEQAETLGLSFLERHKSYGPLYDLMYSLYIDSSRPIPAENILKRKVANNPKNSLFLTQLSRHYWRAGKPEEVERLWQAIATNLRDFPQAYLEAGDFYAQMRSWEPAIRQYAAGIEADPKQALVYKKRIVSAFLSQGRPQDAERILDEVLRDRPDDKQARASHAALLVAKASPEPLERGIAEYKSLLEKDPDNREYKYQLAGAYHLKGDDEAARTQYLSILAVNRTDGAALYALAQLHVRRQRFDEAMRYADQVLALDPGHAGARLVRSAALVSAGQYNDARTALNGVIRDHPRLKEARLQLALLDVAQKRYSEAESILRKEYQPGDGDFRALKGIVEVHSAQKRWDKALAMLQGERKTLPQSIEVKKLLAKVSAESGRLDLAIPYYRELAQALPNSPDIRMQLGLLYQAQAQLDPAIAEYSKAIRISPENAMAHALYGKALDQAGRKLEAAVSYRRSLSLEAGNPSVMNNLAYLTAEIGGDLDEALQLSRRAVERDPNPAFKDTLGWVYLKKKDKGAALHIFQTLTRQQPDNPVFRAHLAMALN
jgi:tetratricopeptide (TPR) repeat protein